MSKNRTKINIDTDTFGGLVVKVDQLIDDISNIIVTTDADGSTGITSGNARVTGNLTANAVFTNTISGGNSSTPDVLTVTSNTVVNNALSTVNSANTLITGDLNIVGITKNTKIDSLNNTIKSAANTSIEASIINTLSTDFIIDTSTFDIDTNNVNIDAVNLFKLTAATANIVIPSISIVASNNINISGNTTFVNSITGNLLGNANTSNKWLTARTLTMAGDITGNTSIDGSSNITLTVSVNDDSHGHSIGNITNLASELANRLTLTGKAADSELLDGINSSSFVRTDTISQKNSKLQMMGSNAVTFGNSSELEIFHDPTSTGIGFIRTTAGGIYIRRASDSVNVHRMFTNGDYIANGEIYAHSDARLKKDINTITDPIEKIMQLRGVSYTKDNKKSIGVIAQEVIDVIPEVVQNTEGEMMSVSYGNLVGLLIEAIKDQQKQIDILKSKIE